MIRRVPGQQSNMSVPVLFLLSLVVLQTPLAGAQVVDIASGVHVASSGGQGFFTGTLDYDPATQDLTVTLTNLNSTYVGGLLTAFVFNNPNNDITGVSLVSSPAGIDNLLGGPSFQDSVPANPLGDFDIGVTEGKKGFEGGGNPNFGLARGDSGTWTFNFTGSNLNKLTTDSFVNELSSNPSNGFSPSFFAVRFRGGPSSDKVTAVVVTPEGSGVGLLACGLLPLAGAIAARRRRR